MLGTLSALLGLAALSASATHYMLRVSRGDLRAPPAVLLASAPLAGVLSGAGLTAGLLRGEPLVPLVPLAAAGLSAAAIATWLHSQRRVPQNTLRIASGDTLPAFSALTPDGQPFDSRSLRGRRVLFKFFRGEWCPFCQAELKRFDALRPLLAARGIEIVALSKDTPEAARRHRERDQLGITLLCDPDLAVIRQFGVEHHKALEISAGPRLSLLGLAVGTRPAFRSMAIPTTLLVDEGSVVCWIDQSEDYKVRSSTERVLGAITAAFGGSSLVEAPLEPIEPEVCPSC